MPKQGSGLSGVAECGARITTFGSDLDPSARRQQLATFLESFPSLVIDPRSIAGLGQTPSVPRARFTAVRPDGEHHRGLHSLAPEVDRAGGVTLAHEIDQISAVNGQI